jgi:guanylate kinase
MLRGIFRQIGFSVSHTTRQRYEDTEGVDYIHRPAHLLTM